MSREDERNMRLPVPETVADSQAARAPSEVFAPLPQPGDRVGQYELGRVVGKGAMGLVMRAADKGLRRDVAIKFLKPQWALVDELREAFVQEARALASVRHPNVVEVFDFGVHDGLPYFVMGYLPGPTLESWTVARGPDGLSFDEALGLIDQVCQGVDALHTVGLVHGDLKPANLLTGEGFRLAVGDLGVAGLAAIMSGDEPVLAGSHDYMAPELLAADARSRPPTPTLARRRDVWAIGAIAYELFSGRKLMREGRRGPQLHGLRPDLPVQACDAVEAALLRDPSRRLGGAIELRDALRGSRPRGAATTARPALRQAPRQSGNLSPSQASRQAMVIMLDDDPEFLSLARTQVESLFAGVQIFATTDAEAALARATSGDSILLTDLDMPELDGFSVTERARKNSAALPIVVVTGHGNADHWRRLRQLGANACVLKPIDEDGLGAVLRAQAERAGLRLSAPGASKSP